MTSSLFRIGRWLVPVTVVLFAVGAPSADPGRAEIEPIYTLPFLDDTWEMTCGWHCYYDPEFGWHVGSDYKIGDPAAGEFVAAAAAGTVMTCIKSPSAGNYIVMDHGDGHITRYLHLDNDDYLPDNGEAAVRGQVIGYEGSTGLTDPPGFNHLHFETRHEATTFTCGKDGTPYSQEAQATWPWTEPYPGPPAYADPLAFGDDTIGVVRDITRDGVEGEDWFLRNTLSAGWPDCAFERGLPGHIPLMGDWNGDGVETTGYFDPNDSSWHLRDTNTEGSSQYAFNYGIGGDLPVVGDWDRNGTDTPGIFRPSTREWHLRNSNTGGSADVPPFVYGIATDTPFAGDWNGDGIDTAGIVRSQGGNNEWHLRNLHTGGPADVTPFTFGTTSHTPVTGDWDGDGDDTIGYYDPPFSGWHLNDELDSSGSEHIFSLGLPTDTPVIGDLDHDGALVCERNESELYPCGNNPLDSTSDPERVDGAFAGVDDDKDGATDEFLPSWALPHDCDGDGYTGQAELSIYGGVSVDRDQDPCGGNVTPEGFDPNDGWPADTYSEGPFSINRVEIQDVTSFLVPVRRLDSSPGDPEYHARWDMIPGITVPFDDWIEIIDLVNITIVAPPMLGGEKAYGGPSCPWPP